MANRVWLGAGLLMLLLLGTTALFAPMLAPRDPLSQNLDQDLIAHSREHPLGTDKLGRDLLSRIIYGGRVSLLVGMATVTLSLTIGVAIGSFSGYFGGLVDQMLMRLVDILMAFPGILLAIAFTAVLGPGLDHVIVALCLIGWTGYARLVRGEILSLRERDFIHAARALGGRPKRIILRHLLPNLLPPLLIQATFGLAAAVVAEGSLSFLGLGVEPPTPSWGSMLNDGRQFLLVAPHLTTYPGLALMITVLALNLVGDALQERLNGRNR
ncbi:MAG: ABC transporter permease [Deltaproteobacteria bacterium]|jgi:peptide/nickel transport system permease protein|nr:MAG: ABC transporter permease [Deltaproteobacteria bacterium]